MFASNTAEIINFEKPLSKSKKNDVFTKILYVHKKLKEVAQYESIAKQKYSIAKLNPEKIEKLKLLESKIGCYLVAFDFDPEIEENKSMILNRISSLLDEYLCLCKSRDMLQPVSKYKNQEDGFSGFFQQ